MKSLNLYFSSCSKSWRNCHKQRISYRLIRDNLLIQTNIIDAAYRNNVEKLLFLGSTCIYPKMAPQPFLDRYILTGLLEPTIEPYAITKIAWIKMYESYNRNTVHNIFQ
jgi:nucleoside-diphosphate-sugar epimerase